MCIQLLFLVCHVQASAPEDLVGTWALGSTGDTLVFYGGGIGSRADGEAVAYFKYVWSEPDVLTLNFGADSLETYTLALSDNVLTLTEEGQPEITYNAQGDLLEACIKSLHQLAGAKALYRVDHPNAMTMTIHDLTTYLDSFPPPCPEGGMYMIGELDDPPRCTIPGHSIDQTE